MVDRFLPLQSNCVQSENTLSKCSIGSPCIKTLNQRVPKMRQTFYFPSRSTNYLLPAFFLNPAVVLHVINTAVSHLQGASCARSFSSNPFIESLGPVPGSTLYLDMHANDRLCWKYTALMVLVQLLVMWKMHENTEIEEEGDMILPTERDTEQGRMRESAVDVDDPALFDMKYMVNGQMKRHEPFVRHKGRISRIGAGAIENEEAKKARDIEETK